MHSKARAYCACSRCGPSYLDIFLSSIFSFLSPSLRKTADIISLPAGPDLATCDPKSEGDRFVGCIGVKMVI